MNKSQYLSQAFIFNSVSTCNYLTNKNDALIFHSIVWICSNNFPNYSHNIAGMRFNVYIKRNLLFNCTSMALLKWCSVLNVDLKLTLIMHHICGISCLSLKHEITINLINELEKKNSQLNSINYTNKFTKCMFHLIFLYKHDLFGSS